MKKKLSVILAACLLMVSLTTPSFAEDKEAAEKSFSLQQATDYALANNPMIGISQTGIDKAKVSLREAVSAFNKMEDSDLVSFEATQVKRGYFKRLAQMGVTIAEKSQLQTKEMIKFSVENSYFNLLNAKENLDIQNSIVNASKENYDIVNNKYKLGLASEVELVAAEASYSQSQLDQKSANSALEYAKMSFNKTLGLPLDTKVNLTDTLKAEAPPEINLEEKVASALQNRMEIISASEQYEVDKLNLEVTSTWYPENTYKYQSAKYAMENSSYALENSRQTVELSVRKAYMDMMDAYNALGTLDSTIAQLEKVYDVTKLKYDTGMATNNEVVDALNKTKEIKLKKSQALLGFNLAKKQFEASYGIGISSPASVQQ